MNTKRTTNQSADESEAQDIATLKKRYEKLQTEKTRAETKLESAQKELQNLKKDAKKDYGTDELPALQKKLQDMKEQNEKKRAASANVHQAPPENALTPMAASLPLARAARSHCQRPRPLASNAEVA